MVKISLGLGGTIRAYGGRGADVWRFKHRALIIASGKIEDIDSILL